MKIYHICECCELIFDIQEVDGPDGAIELKGICNECKAEMDFEQKETSSTYLFLN